MALLNLDLNTLRTSQPQPWLTAPAQAPSQPLVPRGDGPSTSRQAEAGDLLQAIARIPAVNAAIAQVSTRANDYMTGGSLREMLRGERPARIVVSALIAGTLLAGVLSNDASRRSAFDLIHNWKIKVPRVPGLSVQFNLTGPDQRVVFTLDLSDLLRAAHRGL